MNEIIEVFHKFFKCKKVTNFINCSFELKSISRCVTASSNASNLKGHHILGKSPSFVWEYVPYLAKFLKVIKIIKRKWIIKNKSYQITSLRLEVLAAANVFVSAWYMDKSQLIKFAWRNFTISKVTSKLIGIKLLYKMMKVKKLNPKLAVSSMT